MSTIAGLRGTGDFGADERPKNFRETILFLNANGDTPIQGLLSMMGSEATDDPEFAWWEEKLLHIRLQMNGAVVAGATTLVFDAETNPPNQPTGAAGGLGLYTTGAGYLVAGDLLAVETASGIFSGEVVLVNATPTGSPVTNVSVIRGAAGTTAAAIADDAFLTKIGNVHSEGSLSAASTTKNPIKLRNYTQIFKQSYEVTNTTRATKLRTGDAVKNDKRRKLFDVMRDMEMQMIFGNASETLNSASNGKPSRTTAGFTNFITTNRTTFTGGTWNEDNFIDAVSPLFNWMGDGRSTNQRIAFCGNEALTEINKLARNSSSTRINFDSQITQVYGMNLIRWILPQGEVFFKTHPLFNIHPHLTRSMLILNPPFIKERPLRPMKFEDNIQPNDADYVKGQWIAETGLEVNFEETMGFLQNIGGPRT